MSIITPNSTIRLLANAPIDPTNRNFLLFDSKTAQDNYMASKGYVTKLTCTYVNKADDGTPINQVRITGSADEFISAGVNAIMYLNNSFTSEPFWYYGNVTDIKQVNKSVCAIDFEPNWLLNSFNSAVFGRSFIERAHVAKENDIPGNYIIPEGLETGRFVVNEYKRFFNNGIFPAVDNNPCVIVVCSVGNNSDLQINSNTDLNYVIKGAIKAFAGGCVYCGIYQGAIYVASSPIINFDGEVNTGNIDKINSFIQALVVDGQIDKIRTIYLAPERIVEGMGMQRITDEVIADPESLTTKSMGTVIAAGNSGRIPEGDPLPTYDLYDGPQTTETDKLKNIDVIDGYSPRNKKLLTQEYNYLVLSNGEDEKEYGFEWFWRGQTKYRTPTFAWVGGISENGCLIGCYPVGYNMTNDQSYLSKFFDVDNGLTLDQWPQCTYAFSSAINDFRANRSQMKTGRVVAETNFIGGVAGPAISGAINGLSGIMPTKQNIIDPKHNNLDTAGSAISTGASGFSGMFGALGNYLTETAKLLAKTQDNLRAPNIVGGVSNSSLRAMFQGSAIRWEDTGSENNCPAPLDFIYRRMSITAEIAKSLDDFFDLYGYKVNKFVDVNSVINNRTYFNFIKSPAIMLTAWDGPIEAYFAILSAFEGGVTFWHDPNHWRDYSIAAQNV